MGDNDESTQMKKEYGHYTFRKVVFISVSIILVFILFWVSLCVCICVCLAVGLQTST